MQENHISHIIHVTKGPARLSSTHHPSSLTRFATSINRQIQDIKPPINKSKHE